MSFLESLAGNAAITAEGLIGSRIAKRDAMELEDHRSANSLANQKSMAQFNEELAASRAATIEALKVKVDERNAAIYNKAADAAPAAGDERRFQKFKADIGQTDATEDQLRTVFENQYNERTVGNFGGADRYVDPESANRMDIVNELRKGSAPATMVRSAQDDYKAQLGAERQAQADATKQRGQDLKEAGDKEDRKIDSRRVDAMFARISSGGGSSSDTKEWLGVIGEQRKGLAAELADLRKTRDTKLEATPDPKKKQAIIAEFDTQIATAKRAGQAIDDKIEAVTSRLLSKSGAPKMDKPAGGADQSKQSKHLTQAEYNALPKGATFTNPKDGKQYKKQ